MVFTAFVRFVFRKCLEFLGKDRKPIRHGNLFSAEVVCAGMGVTQDNGSTISHDKLTTRRQAMNQRNFQYAYAAARTMVAATVAAAIFFAASPAMAAKGSEHSRVETRIEEMHAKLKITKAEEDLWTKVAEVMRDNGKKMDDLTSARMEKEKTINAVDDLKSYGEIVDEHADGIKRFTPVFADLYASMSDEQKAEADKLFRHEGKH